MMARIEKESYCTLFIVAVGNKRLYTSSCACSWWPRSRPSRKRWPTPWLRGSRQQAQGHFAAVGARVRVFWPLPGNACRDSLHEHRWPHVEPGLWPGVQRPEQGPTDRPVRRANRAPRGPSATHDGALARRGDGLRRTVLWLDCDREGENICFEVIHTTCMYLNQTEWPGAYERNIFRAHFSSLAPADLSAAYSSLGWPSLNESRSVDARQLIDLKLGVAFSRFQTRFFRTHLPELGKISVTYGPCQTPTLWFIVQRHDLIATHTPQPFWTVGASLRLADGSAVRFSSRKGAVWSEAEAAALTASAAAARGVAVAAADCATRASVDPDLPRSTPSLSCEQHRRCSASLRATRCTTRSGCTSTA